MTLHGHAHPAIAEAIAEQARKLEQVIFAGFTPRTRGGIGRAASSKFLPPGLEHIFFSDDGSTAVEVALKMAVQYWWNVGQPEKAEIVALEHAYHGDTAGSHVRGRGFRLLRAVRRACASRSIGSIPLTASAARWDLPRDDCQIDCLDKLRRLLAARAGAIAAVIVEPLLQGAGGMIVHPVEFLQGIRQLCERAQCAADRR